MLLFYSVIVFFAVMFLYAFHCGRVLYGNTKSLQKLLSKKTFLIFYLASRSKINNSMYYLMMNLGTTLVLILVVGVLFLTNKATKTPGFDGDPYYLKNFQLFNAFGFDVGAMGISGLVFYVLEGFYFDKASISFQRIDPVFDDVLNYRLVDHKLIDRMLAFRGNFYGARRLLVKGDASKYSRKRFAGIHSIICIYAFIEHVNHFQKFFIKSKKEFTFSNGVTTLKFSEMLKFINNCFDRSAIDINLVKAARFSHAKQYLDQLEEIKI